MSTCWWNHPLSANTFFVMGNTTELKSGGSQFDVVLQNLSGREVILELHTKVGMISAANKVPPLLAPEVIKGDVEDNEDDEKIQCKSAQMDLLQSKSKQTKVDPEEILQKAILLETIDWDLAGQQDTHNLIHEYDSIFSLNYLDLGKTSIIKHSIKIEGSNTIQRMLLMYFPRNVQRSESIYTRND